MAFLGTDLISFERNARGSREEQALTAGQVGLWLFLATVTMFFAGFTSAVLVRRTAPDWQPIPIPELLWLNTGLLVSSSFTMERVRRLARQQQWSAMRSWLVATALLHSAIVVEKCDEGIKFIHATPSKGVRYDFLNQEHWTKNFMTARRFL